MWVELWGELREKVDWPSRRIVNLTRVCIQHHHHQRRETHGLTSTSILPVPPARAWVLVMPLWIHMSVSTDSSTLLKALRSRWIGLLGSLPPPAHTFPVSITITISMAALRQIIKQRLSMIGSWTGIQCRTVDHDWTEDRRMSKHIQSYYNDAGDV